LKRQTFALPLPFEKYSNTGIRLTYTFSLGMHRSCDFCSSVNTRRGSRFFAELAEKLAQARKKVTQSHYFSSATN
jgi:hypothetical protein